MLAVALTSVQFGAGQFHGADRGWSWDSPVEKSHGQTPVFSWGWLQLGNRAKLFESDNIGESMPRIG